jgi:hypothetical protein
VAAVTGSLQNGLHIFLKIRRYGRSLCGGRHHGPTQKKRSEAAADSNPGHRLLPLYTLDPGQAESKDIGLRDL